MKTIRSVKLKAFAKVNYSLDVLGLRDDGFHEIRTVLQSVSLHDTLEISTRESGFELSVEPEEVCASVEQNTVYKAWSLLCEAVERELPASIRLRKEIPSGAGLGGGSADAAAALVGLDRLFGLGLSDAELAEIATDIGADVPFCLSGGTMLGEGVGADLRTLPAPPPHSVSIAKPAAKANTAKVYRFYDEIPRESLRDTDAVISALEIGDLRALGASVGNDLTSVTAKFAPQVKTYASAFFENGALGASMSGTGTAVYALFDSRENATRSSEAFQAPFFGVFVPVGRGVEVLDLGGC